MNTRFSRRSGWVLSLFLLLAGSLRADDPQDAEKEIRATQEVIRTAESLANGLSIYVEKIWDYINRAKDMQEEAIDLAINGQYTRAISLTRQARMVAYIAIELAQNAKRAKKAYDKTLEYIRKRVDIIRDSDNERAKELLRKAALLKDNAISAFQEGQYELSFRLFKSAIELFKRALRLVGDDIGLGKDKINRELMTTDKLIERSEDILTERNEKRAEELFERGREIQENAKDAFARAQYLLALKQTIQARTIVTRALDRLEGPLGEESIKQMIDATDNLLKSYENIKNSGDSDAIELLESAELHQSKAKELLEVGEYESALIQTKVARRLALQVKELISEEEFRIHE